MGNFITALENPMDQITLSIDFPVLKSEALVTVRNVL